MYGAQVDQTRSSPHGGAAEDARGRERAPAEPGPLPEVRRSVPLTGRDDHFAPKPAILVSAR
jgi:hypothetical protein